MICGVLLDHALVRNVSQTVIRALTAIEIKEGKIVVVPTPVSFCELRSS